MIDDANQNWRPPLWETAMRIAAGIAVVTALAVTITALVCGGLR